MYQLASQLATCFLTPIYGVVIVIVYSVDFFVGFELHHFYRRWQQTIVSVRNCPILIANATGENSRLLRFPIGSADFPNLVFYAFQIISIFLFLFINIGGST